MLGIGGLRLDGHPMFHLTLPIAIDKIVIVFWLRGKGGSSFLAASELPEGEFTQGN